MDLEMTGLDPTADVIVEIATLITDDDLVIVAEGPDLVVHQPVELLDRMLPVAASTVSLEEAGTATLDFLRAHVPEAATVPLCGNSIGTDRRFLAAWLPAVEAHLHYRSVDVSTIKELARRWYPGLLGTAPRKAGSHRALDDIRESIAELRWYREHLFRPSP
jgi:oligoribonuclease